MLFSSALQKDIFWKFHLIVSFTVKMYFTQNFNLREHIRAAHSASCYELESICVQLTERTQVTESLEGNTGLMLLDGNKKKLCLQLDWLKTASYRITKPLGNLFKAFLFLQLHLSEPCIEHGLIIE